MTITLSKHIHDRECKHQCIKQIHTPTHTYTCIFTYATYTHLFEQLVLEEGSCLLGYDLQPGQAALSDVLLYSMIVYKYIHDTLV